MNAAGKSAAAAGVLAASLALLVVLFVSARTRAKISHCRNNVRHVGGLMARNWSLLDRELSGRAFWQNVREVAYKKETTGEWNAPYRAAAPPGVENPRDVFLCPVYGKTLSLPQSAEAIDFRGPRRLPERPQDAPGAEPLGADREGNHSSGGHVLLWDTSVVEHASAESKLWSEAARALKD